MANDVYVPPHPDLERMSREEWGKLLWNQLHARPDEMSDDPVVEDKWLQGFMEAIPCPQCRWHFWQHCEKHKPDFTSPKNFRTWGWWCHVLVNLRLGKPVFPWPVKSWGEPICKFREGLVDYSE